ncbi:MAG: hypothetical protein JRH10_15480 [Deltaproteobacteria bacterium]|nr:hypothetical protein [Deltaproteobacteria bacterium]MBW2447087.1 hypothetical protein [Deltaproteobacteria bacterium]
MDDPIQALTFYVAFLFSTTVHEAAHAWAALRGGDPTAYHGGQVSLDPLPHIRREPVGMVLLPVVTVAISGWPLGFASAPYDRHWAERHPRRAAWMALAGPAANLALLLIAAFMIRVGVGLEVLHAPDSIRFAGLTAAATHGWEQIGWVIGVFFSMNLVLLILNLLPVPPLDGSGALPLLLSPSAAERWLEFTRQPMLGWVGILIAWRVFHEIFMPVFFFAADLLYPEMTYG